MLRRVCCTIIHNLRNIFALHVADEVAGHITADQLSIEKNTGDTSLMLGRPHLTV